jgi:SprT protein
MPLLRQLEFAFRTVAGIADLGRFAASEDAGVTDPGYNKVGRHLNLEETARELLRSLGAARIARDLRVEWNPRLKTAAARADYHEKLISLNPRLVDHPAEIDRTLRHELAHILAQFRAGRRKISSHGPEWRQACFDLGIADEKRCHNLPFPVRTYAARFVYRCPNCRQEFRRVRRVRRAVACLACCRKHNGGDFDPRFRLKLVKFSIC